MGTPSREEEEEEEDFARVEGLRTNKNNSEEDEKDDRRTGDFGKEIRKPPTYLPFFLSFFLADRPTADDAQYCFPSNIP